MELLTGLKHPLLQFVFQMYGKKKKKTHWTDSKPAQILSSSPNFVTGQEPVQSGTTVPADFSRCL